MRWPHRIRRWVGAANARLGGVPYAVLRPRRFQAYCVGHMKTGTNSIADIFRANYRSAHEPGDSELIRAIPGPGREPGPAEVSRFLAARDRRMWLEMDSSHLNYFFIEGLVRTFPRAKFILTVRECRDWLDSMFNHQLGGGPVDADWQRARDLRFRTGDGRHPEPERALAERGLYTLDGYLSCWAAHNRRVMAAVPRDRLLVVRTREIGRSLPAIAAFLGVPAATLDSSRAHGNRAVDRAAGKFNVLPLIDPDYLAGKIREHCGELMAELFPESAGDSAPPAAGPAAAGRR
jgi:hypothetical protein